MKAKTTLTFLFSIILCFTALSQDTFSIVAMDSITGEVGSAGASCVDMNSFPGYDDDFLGELFPGLGAINTQAWYLPANQVNARNRMNAGDTPAEIIDWLIANDVQSQPQKRQYGIVAFVDGSPQSAAHTGTATDDYKNHVLGPNYSIQGNILLGQEVLDSMEARFLMTEGDLACKLMAALQGAKMVGADTRCASNGTSSLFSFVKVAQPTDTFGFPSFVVSVRTSNGDNIEPIDTLQTLFDLVHDCTSTGMNKQEIFNSRFSVYPNPTKDIITVESNRSGIFDLEILDVTGNKIIVSKLNKMLVVQTSNLVEGIYFLRISNGREFWVRKVIKTQ